MEAERRLSAVSADASRPPEREATTAPVCGSQREDEGRRGGGAQVTGSEEEVESQREVVWSSRGRQEIMSPEEGITESSVRLPLCCSWLIPTVPSARQERPRSACSDQTLILKRADNHFSVIY